MDRIIFGDVFDARTTRFLKDYLVKNPADPSVFYKLTHEIFDYDGDVKLSYYLFSHKPVMYEGFLYIIDNELELKGVLRKGLCSFQFDKLSFNGFKFSYVERLFSFRGVSSPEAKHEKASLEKDIERREAETKEIQDAFNDADLVKYIKSLRHYNGEYFKITVYSGLFTEGDIITYSAHEPEYRKPILYILDEDLTKIIKTYYDHGGTFKTERIHLPLNIYNAVKHGNLPAGCVNGTVKLYGLEDK